MDDRCDLMQSLVEVEDTVSYLFCIFYTAPVSSRYQSKMLNSKSSWILSSRSSIDEYGFRRIVNNKKHELQSNWFPTSVDSPHQLKDEPSNNGISLIPCTPGVGSHIFERANRIARAANYTDTFGFNLDNGLVNLKGGGEKEDVIVIDSDDESDKKPPAKEEKKLVNDTIELLDSSDDDEDNTLLSSKRKAASKASSSLSTKKMAISTSMCRCKYYLNIVCII